MDVDLKIEEFALDDGWYADGPRGQRDYYVPFGFHFYGLLLGEERYRERAVTFARQFASWFAADGAALPFGRSLGYRFAQGAFWSALAAADLEALPWAEVRGLAQNHLGWWWRQPCLDEAGGLTVGYAYPNTGVVEQYMAGGSPYWGTKVFAALAAAADHPFWTVTPAPSSAPSLQVQPMPSMVVARDGHGDVVALNGQDAPAWGARGGAAKYAKFAYSTLAGIGVPTGGDDIENFAFDSCLALSCDGRQWRTRLAGESSFEGSTLVLRWQPWPDVSIETRLSHHDDGHRRVHKITTGRALETMEGGFCVPWVAQGALPPGTVTGPGSSQAVAEGIESMICDPGGDRDGRVLHPMPGSHLLFTRTALPALFGRLEPGEHTLTCDVFVTRL